MRVWASRAILAAGVTALAAVPAAGQSTWLHGVAIEDSLSQPSTVPDAPPAAAGAPRVSIVVRLTIDRAEFSGPSAVDALARLDARLATYRAPATVILALGAFPVADADDEAWLTFVRSVAERTRGRVAAYQVGDVATGPLPAAARYGFLLKRASVETAGAKLVQGPVPVSAVEWQRQVYDTGVAAYVDGLAIAGPGGADGAAFRASVAAMTSLVERRDPSASVVLGPFALSDDPPTAAIELTDAMIRGLGTPVGATAFAGRASSLAAAVTSAARLSDLFAGDLVALDGTASGLRFLSGGRDVTASVPHALLFGLAASDTYLVYGGVPGLSTIDVDVRIASMSAPMVRDPHSGRTDPPAFTPAAGGAAAHLVVRAADHPLILDFNFGSTGYATSTGAGERTLPSVEEIIARYQQTQAGQDARVRNYIAHMRSELHFHPSVAEPAWNVVTENQLFWDQSGAEWEEQRFSINGATWTGQAPSLPLLQPEKVLSLPLDLRLNQDYRYRLEGVETVGEREAYIVGFDPVAGRRALYRGTVWIDRATFARLKVAAVETQGHGVVVSNEEAQTFAPAGVIDGHTIWLLDRLVSRQTVLVAGRTLILEHDIAFTDVRLNVPDFDAARAAVRSGDRVMYRDTDAGVRYFVKRGAERVVSAALTTSARALAMGADIDPSFDYPLPIAGLNILDFNFLHRDMQLALLFGGVIAFGNIQHANLWGGKFDASVDFFGLALKSNDSVFDGRGERGGERVGKIPVATGVNLGYQITTTQKITGRYEFDYDAYFRDVDTAADFVVPASTGTSGEGVGYEYRRHGYGVTAHAAAYQRRTWTPWGAGFDPATKTYAKFDAGVSKDFIFATFHTVHLNGQYFGGRRLDRFSMYQFGLFDQTRIHGVPSAVRFGELAMLRGSYSFNLFDQYRMDAFVDQAFGRSGISGSAWRPVTGVGLGLNLRGPKSTIVRTDLGKSFLPPEYRGAGSFVLQIMLLKPL